MANSTTTASTDIFCPSRDLEVIKSQTSPPLLPPGSFVLLDFVLTPRLLTDVIPQTAAGSTDRARIGARQSPMRTVMCMVRSCGQSLSQHCLGCGQICPTWICSGVRIISECIKICIFWQRLPFNSIIV